MTDMHSAGYVYVCACTYAHVCTVNDKTFEGKLSRFINDIHFVGKTFAVCPQSPIKNVREDNNKYFDTCA